MSTECQFKTATPSDGRSGEQSEIGTAESSDARRKLRRPYAGRVTCPELGNCELAALDLSPDGVGLLSPYLFKTGQPVTLYFLNGAKKVQGVVRRVRTVFSCDWQVGVEFLQQQDALVQAIEADV